MYGQDHLTLWTVQPLCMWQEMQRTRWLRCDGRRSVLPRQEPDFRAAYDWMRQQMQERIPGYGGRYPIWAWKDVMPRKRDYANHDPAEPKQVRIKFRAAPDAVLLSSVDAWHAVLEYWYIGPQSEGKLFQGLRRGEASPELAVRLEASWQHIFDISKATEYGWHVEGNPVQAVTEAVHLSQVVAVHELF